MLIRHEIVNAVLGDIPVAVTYCPLCNTALVFDRRVAGRVLDFGTSGNLRRSDLVMWDRQTQSWWQQITGEAIVGDLTGTRLTVLPAQVLSFSDFRKAYPEGLVLSRETGIYPAGTYEVAPYAGYDREGGKPFLFSGEVDPRLPPLEWVLTIEIAGEAVAYPFSGLRQTPVINDSVGRYRRSPAPRRRQGGPSGPRGCLARSQPASHLPSRYTTASSSTIRPAPPGASSERHSAARSPERG